jgi:4-amino-4-deoxy-L-arabinose transferase-like glycosyltransferase
MIMHWWKQRSLAEQSFLFLVLWIAVVFGFFSLAAGKRGVYLLPLYPALALLTARWFQTERELGAIAKIGLRALGGICFLVAVAVAVVFFWSFQGWPLPYMLSAAASPSRAEELKLVVDSILRNQGWTLRVFLGAGVLLWFLVGWELFRLELGRIPLKLSLVSLLSWLSVQMIFVPTLAYARSYGPLMKEVNRVEALGGKVYIYGGGFDSSSLIFYHRGPIPELQDGRLALIERLRFGRDHVLMSEKEWEKIQSAVQNPNLRVVKSGGGPDGDAPLVFISAAVTEPNS